MIKRFDGLDIATADLADAISTYQKNFDFTVEHTDGADQAKITLGDGRIRLRSGASVAELISSSGEGLAAIWLEADDVEEVAEKLKGASIAMSPIRVEGNRRVLAIDPLAVNMVPLFIFDRR